MTSKRTKINIRWEVISFIISVCILAACSALMDDEDSYVPLDEKYKIKFKKGDTLTYVNQFSDTFQLKIVDVYLFNIIQSKRGSGGPHNFIEQQVVEYDSLFTNPVFPASHITARSEQSSGWLLWHYRLNNRIDYVAETLPSIELNGTTFQSVFQIDVDGAVDSIDIVTWYYTYKDGFAGFELQNGEIFSLRAP